MADSTAVKTKTYRYGEKSAEKVPAWNATAQQFKELRTVEGASITGEFVILESKGVLVAFVNLVDGMILPYTSVVFAVPA